MEHFAKKLEGLCIKNTTSTDIVMCAIQFSSEIAEKLMEQMTKSGITIIQVKGG